MPTALELSREEWQPYIEAARQQPIHSKPTPAELEIREHLLVLAREAAAALKVRFDVQRVVLFGSLADADWFTVDSDIDLAVEGLAPDDYWQAWKVAEDIIRERSVDLIEIEIARESLVRAIEQYGIEL